MHGGTQHNAAHARDLSRTFRAAWRRPDRDAGADRTGVPRPILWLAFAGWATSCAMLFITLVQREPMAGREDAATRATSLPAIVSVALETARGTFGDAGKAEPWHRPERGAERDTPQR